MSSPGLGEAAEIPSTLVVDVFSTDVIPAPAALPAVAIAPPPTALGVAIPPKVNAANAIGPVSYTHLTLPTNREV